MLGFKNHLLWSQTTYSHSYFSDFHVIFMVLAGAARQITSPLVHFFPQLLGAWESLWNLNLGPVKFMQLRDDNIKGKGQIALEILRCKWKASKGTVHVSWKCFFSLRAGCTPAVTASWTQGMLSKVDHSRAALKFAIFKDYNGNPTIPEAKAIKRRSAVQPQRSQYWTADMKWMRKADAGKWHKGDQKHKATGSQMAEKINTWFAHTSKMFLWQDMLNYTRGKFYMPFKKNKKSICCFTNIFLSPGFSEFCKLLVWCLVSRSKRQWYIK